MNDDEPDAPTVANKIARSKFLQYKGIRCNMILQKNASIAVVNYIANSSKRAVPIVLVRNTKRRIPSNW